MAKVMLIIIVGGGTAERLLARQGISDAAGSAAAEIGEIAARDLSSGLNVLGADSLGVGGRPPAGGLTDYITMMDACKRAKRW